MPRTTREHAARRLDGLNTGRVVADFGRHVLVEDEAGSAHPCSVRGRRLRTVCGDRVGWRPGPGGERGVVESLLPRTSELTRPDSRGRPEVLAANMDQLMVVCSPVPAPDPELVDRYLAAAQFMGVAAVVVCNKIELLGPSDSPVIEALLSEYEAAGYPTLRTSAKTGQGLQQLAAAAAGHTSILVGLSGVGKSTLLNSLRPQTGARVGELSERTREGTHTTRASRLYRLPGGGEFIDSPGVREYTPHLSTSQDPASGYVEFQTPGRDCRFRNCRHLDEPGCAVKDGVEKGQISRRRYESYRALVRQQS